MKCKNGCEHDLKLVGNNVVECGMQILTFWRCEICWTTHNIFFSNPMMMDSYVDPPRLEAMSGDNQFEYIKCSRPTDGCYTLIAKKGKYVRKEIIESFGLTIHEPTTLQSKTRPARRLHEIV